MTFVETPWAPLVGDATQAGVQRGIDVRVVRPDAGTLVFQYILRAEMSRIRVPAGGAPARADGLWQHTCFEAFIAVDGVPGYYELNFSPSRQWAIYQFSGYRQGMSPLDVTSLPQPEVRSLEDRLELSVAIRRADFASAPGDRTLKLALTAVVEDDSGTLSYWALKHAPAKPDFHHPDGFVLELTP